MEKAKSYWTYIGWICMGFGLILLAILVWAASGLVGFFETIFGSTHSQLIVSIGAASLCFGCFSIMSGMLSERKLRLLKQTGILHKPIESNILQLRPQRTYFDGFSQMSFRIECIISDPKGKKTLVTSRRLRHAMSSTLVLISEPYYEAMVYENPRKKGDYVVEVLIC